MMVHILPEIRSQHKFNKTVSVGMWERKFILAMEQIAWEEYTHLGIINAEQTRTFYCILKNGLKIDRSRYKSKKVPQ